MQKVERAFIRECIREYHSALGINSKGEAITAILKVNNGLGYESVRSFVYDQPFKGDKDAIAAAALQLFAAKRDQAIAHLRLHGHHATATYLGSLITTYADPSTNPHRRALADVISENWRESFASGDANLQTGVYQIIRRFKPRLSQIKEGGRTTNPDPDNIVIVELMFLDSVSLECVLVTSEGNVYWGTLHINHNHALYGILQRPEDGARQVVHSVLHRFYAVHTKQVGPKRAAPVYSGLHIKTGDFTERLLCGENLFSPVPEEEHAELYNAMRQLFDSEFRFLNVSADQAITPYITGFDGADRESFATLADIPLVDEISRPNGERAELFREPSRTVDVDVLEEIARDRPLSVFRRALTEARTGAGP